METTLAIIHDNLIGKPALNALFDEFINGGLTGRLTFRKYEHTGLVLVAWSGDGGENLSHSYHCRDLLTPVLARSLAYSFLQMWKQRRAPGSPVPSLLTIRATFSFLMSEEVTEAVIDELFQRGVCSGNLVFCYEPTREDGDRFVCILNTDDRARYHTLFRWEEIIAPDAARAVMKRLAAHWQR